MKTHLLFFSVILCASSAHAFGADDCAPFVGDNSVFSFVYHDQKDHQKELIYNTLEECKKAKAKVDQVREAEKGTKIEVCGCQWSAHIGLIFLALPPVPTTQVSCYLFKQDGSVHDASFGDKPLPPLFSGSGKMAQCETDLVRVEKERASQVPVPPTDPVIPENSK